MNIKRKNVNIFLLSFFVASFLLSIGTQKAFAGACLSAQGTCWTLDNATDSCTAYTSDSGKALVSVPAGDVACAGVYAPPVKCCKVGTVASTKPAAASKGSDAGAATTSAGSTKFTNPLDFTTVEDFLGGIMVAIQKIIAVLALVFIMIGATMILVSAGNPKMVEQGKAAITMALVGLALGVAAPSLLKELSNIIGWGPGSGGAALTLSEIAVRVLNFLLGTMGILALIMLVIGAIMYLTSAGDDDRIKKGKEIFKSSLLGLVLAMSAMVLVTQIASFFNTPAVPAASTTTTGVCAGKAVGTACHAVSDSISWDGTCNAAGSCQQ